MFIKNALYEEDILYILSRNLNWELFNHKSMLITGATGMIGTLLTDVLMYLNMERKFHIQIYTMGRNSLRAKERFSTYWTHPMFHFWENDITTSFTFTEDIDFIINCASNTHPRQYAEDPVGTITTNIFGLDQLLRLSSTQKHCRLAFLSSVEIYGENRGDIKYFDETYCGFIDCNTLRAGYTEGKRAGEALCQAYAKQFHADIVIPRICRVYGPTMLRTDSKALSQFLLNAISKQDIILKSEGKQLYSYIYVADAVSAILTILLNGKSGEAYNVSDQHSDIQLYELAKLLADAVGTRVVFQLPDAIETAGFSKATTALLDSHKLKELDWNAKYTIKDGLSRTLKMLES